MSQPSEKSKGSGDKLISPVEDEEKKGSVVDDDLQSLAKLSSPENENKGGSALIDELEADVKEPSNADELLDN